MIAWSVTQEAPSQLLNDRIGSEAKINTTDCSAPNYGFTGWKAGQKFSIRVNHWGNITRVQAI